MKIFLIIVLVSAVTTFAWADAVTSGDGVEVIADGITDLTDQGFRVVARVVAFLGVALIFIGLYFAFSSKSREEPGRVKKGWIMFILGSLLASGGGVYLSNLFTTTVINQSNDTVQSKWDETWGQD